jgi:hypothetical protein
MTCTGSVMAPLCRRQAAGSSRSSDRQGSLPARPVAPRPRCARCRSPCGQRSGRSPAFRSGAAKRRAEIETCPRTHWLGQYRRQSAVDSLLVVKIRLHAPRAFVISGGHRARRCPGFPNAICRYQRARDHPAGPTRANSDDNAPMPETSGSVLRSTFFLSFSRLTGSKRLSPIK